MATHSPRSIQPAHHQKSKRASLQPRRSHDPLLTCVSAVTSQGLDEQRCTQRLHPPHPDLFDPCGWERCDNADEECYVLGLTQGAFFIFHLLTKPFPSRDQPPIHLDHMTNHLTSHLTTHMTSHMPFQSPALQSHLVLYHLLPSHLRIT